MTNEEWLEHLAHNDIPGLRAWFKAEHVESPESGALVHSAQSDVEQAERGAEDITAALNARIAELEEWLRIGLSNECRLQAERDELQTQVDELTAKLERCENRLGMYRLKLGTCADLSEEIRNVAMGFMNEGMA